MPLGQGYQRKSEGLLGRAEGAYGSLRRGGGETSALGSSLAGQYRRTFQPLNERIVSEAPINSNDLVDRASLDTGLAFDKARGIQSRNLSRMGVNPNSGRFQGLQQQLQLAQAAAEAGAKTRARRSGRRESFERMIAAAGLGRNLPGQATSAMQSGSSQQARAGEGFRALAGDYDRLAGDVAEDKETDSFQAELNNLFGGGGGGGRRQVGYNPGGFGTFSRTV